MAGNAFIRETIQRLRTARNSIVRDMPFFGCLTGMLRFSLDSSVHTVYCDGDASHSILIFWLPSVTAV